MASIRELKKRRNSYLLNDLTASELTEFYKVLNTKYIKTIGTIENNFNYDKEKQEQLKKEIEDINLTLKEKYNTSEVDISTKFNALLKEYLNLQEAYINKEMLYIISIILLRKINIFKAIGVLRRSFLVLYYNYLNDNLTAELESILNFNIKSTITTVAEDIDFFKFLTIPSLNYFKGYEEYTEEVETKFNKLLAEVNETISEYEKLIANPFEDGINLELEVISEVYSNENDIHREQEKILNNVLVYDFDNFKLIRPEGSVNSG